MALNDSHKRKAGFTLAEILLAMMVFAIAITTILGLLARSIETADTILIKDEAIGLSSSVESFMSELSFVDAFNGVKNGVDLYAYRYRTKPDGVDTAPALTDADQLGVTYLVVPRVRPDNDDPNLDIEIAAREGRLFRVNLEVSPANPLGEDISSRSPDSVDDTTGYNSAVLVILADFYEVPDKSVPSGNDPVFSFNFAVRR